jgi:hypothetical protein
MSEKVLVSHCQTTLEETPPYPGRVVAEGTCEWIASLFPDEKPKR